MMKLMKRMAMPKKMILSRKANVDKDDWSNKDLLGAG